MLSYFLLGLLVGWLLEWVIDWAWWRRGRSSRRGARDSAASVTEGVSARRDDLTRIEGIGPKIAPLLAAAGIRNFAELALASPSQLRAVLAAAGPGFRLADPTSWPDQALLAARGEWEALDRLQAQLHGGVRVTS